MVHDVNNINIQAKSTKLELDNVGGIFILLAVGLIIGLLCLICESGVMSSYSCSVQSEQQQERNQFWMQTEL